MQPRRKSVKYSEPRYAAGQDEVPGRNAMPESEEEVTGQFSPGVSGVAPVRVR